MILKKKKNNIIHLPDLDVLFMYIKKMAIINNQYHLVLHKKLNLFQLFYLF